jgi:thiosulfate dehydrogenase
MNSLYSISNFAKSFNSLKKSNNNYILLVAIGASLCSLLSACQPQSASANKAKQINNDTLVYSPPDTATIPKDKFGDMVRYGRDLMINTAYYIGPNGKIGHYTGNKMNCSSCHLDAGTRAFGFNFFSSHARYPQYRGREDKVLSLADRVNNCIERPHNGNPLPIDSKEMEAILCYMKWLSSGVPTGHRVYGDEALDLNPPDRAADVAKGEKVYNEQCILCHGKNGEGILKPDSISFLYPPLWGPQSYQNGSSPSRVLKLAAFIKANMPDKKANWRKPALTDEQAIDVAAFINDDRIHPRPNKKDPTEKDYPDVTTKAIDYGNGPYRDNFSALQHKFGPFKPLIKYYKEHNYQITY